MENHVPYLLYNGDTWYRQTSNNKEKTTMGLFSSADQAKVTGKFEAFKRGNFSAEDTATVLNNTADILNKSSDGPLAKFFDDIKTMCEMVKAWAKKDYKGVPVRTIGMIILTLVYVFSPIDIIPDCIPGIGVVDDSAMVGFCIAAARSDIEDFRVWARAHL